MKASDFNRMTWITQLLPMRKFHITRGSADHPNSKRVFQESPSGRGEQWGGRKGAARPSLLPSPIISGEEPRAEGPPRAAPFPPGVTRREARCLQAPFSPSVSRGVPGPSQPGSGLDKTEPRSSRQHMRPRPPRFPRRFTRETQGAEEAAAAALPGKRERPLRYSPSLPGDRARCGGRRPRSSIQDGGAARAPSPGRTARGGGGALTGGGGSRAWGGTRGGPPPQAPHVAGLPGPRPSRTARRTRRRR